MTRRVCIIGSGPTGIYTLKNLTASLQSLSITIYESEDQAGKGMPYLPGINDPAMLCNIPSVEIPALKVTLVEWLKAQPDEYLATYSIPREQVSERQFYPRVVLGDYFHEQFVALTADAQRLGHHVDVFTRHRVTDIALSDQGILITADGNGPAEAVFDHVVIATGHNWPDQNETKPGYFTSSWPAAALQFIDGGRLGILGTSLSAIDALMTVATSVGTFFYDAAGDLKYQQASERDDFSAVLMSRKGLLPEADFYCPLPYVDAQICTPDAIEKLIASGSSGLLDKTFDLFKAEIALADPEYAAELGLGVLTVDTFAEAYYGRRADTDPFVWAATNLIEAKRNSADEFTVPWRYAIMITHETIAKIVPHLDEEDFERFNASFKGIFIDEYATVPHLSIERLLALRNAGKLNVLKLGSEYRIVTKDLPGGARLELGDSVENFDNFIDATGQTALSAKDLPFPTLVGQGAVREAPTPERSASLQLDTAGAIIRLGGIDVDDGYRAISLGGVSNRIYCAAIPFLLHKNPFVQGITSAAEIAQAVANAIRSDLDETPSFTLLSA